MNTAHIGLFDRSLLHMPLIQVELALKKATSKSRTPVSLYQFDPDFFLSFSIMEESEKEVICRKKVEVTEHTTKIFADQVTAKVVSSIFC